MEEEAKNVASKSWENLFLNEDWLSTVASIQVPPHASPLSGVEVTGYARGSQRWTIERQFWRKRSTLKMVSSEVPHRASLIAHRQDESDGVEAG